MMVTNKLNITSNTVEEKMEQVEEKMEHVEEKTFKEKVWKKILTVRTDLGRIKTHGFIRNW